jgi:hypothetical protein
MTLHGRKDAVPNFAALVSNTKTTASSSHGFENTPVSACQSSQSHQAPQIGCQTTEKRKQQDDDFWSIIALVLALCACAAFACFVTHDSMKTPLRWPTASAVSDIATSHSNWQKAYGISTEHGDIPKLLKSCETTMTHMRAAIKHSDMHNRQSLEHEMQAFSFDTDEVISKFVAWDNVAQVAVDEVQNLNNHVLKTTASGKDVGDLMGRFRQLRGLLSQEGRRIGGRLQHLKEQRPCLLDSLDTVGVHLRTIAELLRDEETSLDREDKDSTERAKVLEGMLQLVTSTHRVINHLQITVKTSGRGLERLRQAVWGIEDNSRCDTRDIPLCLYNVQAAIDGLGDVWNPNKSGSQ